MLRFEWINVGSIVSIALLLSACGGGGGGSSQNPPAPVTLTSIAVTPANSSAVAGTTLQYAATGTYSNGTTQNLSNATWASSAQSVATVNGSGLATGTGPGSATITATSNGVSGSTGVTMSAPMLTGTAAAGLPLTGTVTVKDALGATRTVTIGANGSYSIDVWGMTAPLVLRAEGHVGSTDYVVHSAVAAIGAGGTVNITPLTDLIISNIAGQVAAAYFDSGNFAGLTQDALNAESAALKAKLLPVLQAMEVDASIDLLRTPFTALASALDTALDIIRVSVDPATHIATITNLVNQISIADDIAVSAAQETNPPVLSAEGTDTAADDLPLIRQSLTDFFDLYRTGLPQPAALLTLLSDAFLHDDVGREDFANDIANESNLVGSSVTDIAVVRIDYNYNGGATPLAFVGFRLLNEDGVELNQTRNFTIIRGSDGRWRLHGNQRQLEIEGNVNMVNDSRSGCRASGLEFGVADDDTSNSASIQYVTIGGPGLPTGGLRYERSLQGGDWTLVNGAGNPFWYPFTEGCTHWGAAGVPDADIAAIPDNAVYTIRAFTSSDAEVPTGAYGTGMGVLLPKRPLTLAELNASTRFPAFTTSVDLQSYSGGEITINGTGADPAREAGIYLGLTDGDGLTDDIDADIIPSADGSFSRTFTLSNPGSITQREIRVDSSDGYDRTFMSSARFASYGVSGTLAGLAGSGLVLRLNFNTEPAFNVSPVAGATSFAFDARLDGGAYRVSVAAQPTNPSQACFVTAGGTGTAGPGNVTNVAIVCINSSPYTVGGPVSGLTGTGLSLRVRYVNIFTGVFQQETDLAVAANADAFAFPPGTIPANHGFQAGIATQPAGQTCTITRASNFSFDADITDVSVACVDNAPSLLNGTYSEFDAEAQRRLYLNFNADGTFTTAMIHDTDDCNTATDSRNGNGVEYGVFSWNPSDGAFQLPVPAVVDTNGSCGLSDPSGADHFDGAMIRDGNNLVVRESPSGPVVVTATAVESEPGLLVGAFVPEASNGGLLVFHADGTFLWVDTQQAGLFPLDYGQERGCYTVSGSSVALTLAASCLPDGVPAYDLNGNGGLFGGGRTNFGPVPFSFEDADTLNFRGGKFKRTRPN